MAKYSMELAMARDMMERTRARSLLAWCHLVQRTRVSSTLL